MLQELKAQIFKLSPRDRLALIAAIAPSQQGTTGTLSFDSAQGTVTI
ncbi:MAG: hypothetical protein ACPGVO_14040 [Spirulinaceae cyanobacterium]